MPPRRSGKAASRRARQQRRSRRPTTGGSAPRPQAASPEPTTPSGVGPAPSAQRAGPASINPRPFATGGPVATTSRLGEAARAEYHYVGRDLRNTALLILLMAALLAMAVIVVNLAGIAPS